MIRVVQGDCLEKMKDLPDNSVDSIVTDPPYGIGFMGKQWDKGVPSVDIWSECLRVLKPGGYLLAFAGTRTQHRMAVRIEDAGFEIRDMIAWVYGSGFPKSLNIGKAVDKLNGIEVEGLPTLPMQEATEVGAISKNRRCAICLKAISSGNPCQCDRTYKAQNEWSGWGTALKPALEPITVARKPLAEKTVAENCLKWGTGGINIDGSRVGTEIIKHNQDHKSLQKSKEQDGRTHKEVENPEPTYNTGRFPANLIHDGSDEVVSLFPNDNQRFFYCAKASKSERNKGCEELEEKVNKFGNQKNGEDLGNGSVNDKFTTQPSKNNHPTVKPIALMEYLINMVSRDGATILDPFMGSGTTGVACKNLGRNFIGIELDADYIEIAKARIEAAAARHGAE
jgi:site-specific DNA-methyltransferase (adenine-specific)